MTTSPQRRSFRDHMVSDFFLDDALDWIKTNLAPDDVFSEAVLSDWAEDNGYVKKEEQP